MSAAAFFDLDRTLLRRSSALALAPAFRRRGIISRRMMVEAAAWQVLFVTAMTAAAWASASGSPLRSSARSSASIRWSG